jgi:hypothetical protein
LERNGSRYINSNGAATFGTATLGITTFCVATHTIIALSRSFKNVKCCNGFRLNVVMLNVILSSVVAPLRHLKCRQNSKIEFWGLSYKEFYGRSYKSAIKILKVHVIMSCI